MVQSDSIPDSLKNQRIGRIGMGLFSKKKSEVAQDTNTNLQKIKDDIEPKEFFKVLYQIILSTTRGPKIGPFILDIGKKNVADKISKYVK